MVEYTNIGALILVVSFHTCTALIEALTFSANMLTYQELKERQSWSLYQKIDHAVGVIEQYITRLEGKVYVSFSGGKDSTVLLDIVRRFVAPDCVAVFCNTGNEFPEITRFIKSVDNVTTIRPKYTPKQIIEKYGFPLISKEQSQYINQAKHSKSAVLRSIRINGKKSRNGMTLTQGRIAKKWQHLINQQFDVTEKCCHYLKKEPFRRFGKETGLYPIIGTMADESRLRLQKWLKTGCNSFDSNQIGSYPLSIFTETDIWEYIRMFKIPYCSIYDLADVRRTGCMFCGFGCHMKGDRRFYMLKEHKPKIYDSFMRMENNGVTYKAALRICNIDFPDMLNRQMRLFY